GLTKIPVSNQVSFLSNRFTAQSGPRGRLFQKIDAGASGLIVTMPQDHTGPGHRPFPPRFTSSVRVPDRRVERFTARSSGLLVGVRETLGSVGLGTRSAICSIGAD